MEGVAVLADRCFSVTLKIDCNIILVAEDVTFQTCDIRLYPRITDVARALGGVGSTGGP